jgi:D-xylose transport system ATP-binding protein
VTRPLLALRGIEKWFGGVHAVNGVSLEVHSGEVLGIAGHNGAGKSVLTSIVSGVFPPSAGEIVLDGEPMAFSSPLEARRRGIETIYQNLALADNLDAAANLFLGRELRTWAGLLDRRRMHEEARAVIRRINPHLEIVDRPVRHLSGGQRQSIAIARAVYFKARLVIMDEPTAALGPHETAQVAELIRRMKAEGVGVILVSHDLQQLLGLADRLLVMSRGREVGTRSARQVTHQEIMSMILTGENGDARC